MALRHPLRRLTDTGHERALQPPPPQVRAHLPRGSSTVPRLVERGHQVGTDLLKDEEVAQCKPGLASKT